MDQNEAASNRRQLLGNTIMAGLGYLAGVFSGWKIWGSSAVHGPVDDDKPKPKPDPDGQIESSSAEAIKRLRGVPIVDKEFGSCGYMSAGRLWVEFTQDLVRDTGQGTVIGHVPHLLIRMRGIPLKDSSSHGHFLIHRVLSDSRSALEARDLLLSIRNAYDVTPEERFLLEEMSRRISLDIEPVPTPEPIAEHLIAQHLQYFIRPHHRSA